MVLPGNPQGLEKRPPAHGAASASRSPRARSICSLGLPGALRASPNTARPRKGMPTDPRILVGFLAKGQPPLSSLPTLSAHTGAQLHTELGGSLHGDSTGYNLVSWRMGPHPGPPAVSCEGLCGVQCTTWGRGRGCPGGESVWAVPVSRAERKSLTQRRGTLPQNSAGSGPLRLPEPFAEQTQNSPGDGTSGDLTGVS